jgi:hypothetical protein
VIESYLIYRYLLYFLLPEFFFVRQRTAADLAFDALDSNAVGRTRRGLHGACAFCFRLFGVLVYKTVEEVGERVEREVRARGDGLRREELTRMKCNSRVIMMEEWKLNTTGLAVGETHRKRRTSSYNGEADACANWGSRFRGS